MDLADIGLGALAILVGALFCFRGYLAMRVIIPVWGAFIGFTLGAGLVASITDERLLSTVAGWAVGLVLAFVLALCAYLYYELSVIIALAAIGYVGGAAAMVALGVDWSWVIVAVGVVAGLALAAVAIVADLPVVVLIVLTAIAGATTIVGGAMLLGGVIETDELSRATTERLDTDSWWYLLEIGLAIAGTVVQYRSASRLALRDAWQRGDRRASV